jgi:hypothetical protein
VSGFTSCSLAPFFLVEEPLPDTCRTLILRVLTTLDTAGRKRFANLSCSSVSVILAFLAGASVPADEDTICKSSSRSSSSSSPSRSLSLSAPDSQFGFLRDHRMWCWRHTFNASELSTAAGVLGNMCCARSRTVSHQRSSFLTCKGFIPREANLLKSSWSSTDKSVSQSLFFYLIPKLLDPQPHPSLFK